MDAKSKNTNLDEIENGKKDQKIENHESEWMWAVECSANATYPKWYHEAISVEGDSLNAVERATNKLYIEFKQTFNVIILSTMSSHPLVVGIAGGTSSGKTTVTRQIADALGETNIALLQHDSYYKDLAQFGGKQPSEINFDHPDAYDTELLIQHISDLKAGRTVCQPVYSYTTYRRTGEEKSVGPKSIIIVEGILIFFEPRLRDIIDVKVFVDTDDDERVLRRIRRDVLERGRTVESVMRQYIDTVKPMHLEFVEPTKRWADVIIPRGGENRVAIDLVVRMLRTLDFYTADRE